MLSKLSYITCVAILLYACLGFYPKWQQKGGEATIGWDVSGYYWYLPSIFIYKDLKYQSFADSILKKYEPTPHIQQFSKVESGTYVMTYSAGMACMYLPLFTVAHWLAPKLGYPADGFSTPYQFALQVGSLLFGILGLWYFRRFLLLHFEDKVVAILLFILVIGTNYLNYVGIDGAMSHNWLFTLYVFLLLNTHYFYQHKQYKYAIRIGLLCGLLILIRPSEMVSVLIPLLWGLNSMKAADIRQHIGFIKQQLPKIGVAALFVLLVGFIQLVYWKYASGQWLFYSYRGEGQSFSWLKPHTHQYMFSFRCGWLIYTPMMLLPFIGFIPFLKHGKHKITVLAFCFVSLYVVTAWDTWDYGGFSGRAMIQSYPLFFLPFGALIQQIFKRRIWMWIAFPIIMLFAYINVWVVIQSHKGTGILDIHSMSFDYYWRVVGRWKPDNMDELKKLMDTNELFEGLPKQMQLIHTCTYETDSTIQMPDVAVEGIRSAYVSAGIENSTKSVFTISQPAKWVRVQVDAKCHLKEWEVWRMPQLFVRFIVKDSTEVKTKMIRPHRWFIYDNETKTLFLDVKIPAQHFDKVQVYLWNPGSDKLLMIDNLKVWTFNE
ncbi:hypothetical protein CAP35_06110 [Chitinophagaceae bacterium IBVUCB1]|nr:hypothetical protein CAP35_06110 [Chitinophagaceae bacterium IBVUCB1]